MPGRDQDLSTTLLAILALPPVIYVSIFLHELGHATMARLCGFRVTSFGLGLGGKCLAFGVGGTRIYLTSARPLQGLTFSFATQIYPSRWASAAMLAGGVIANGLASAACFVLWYNSVPGSTIWGVAALYNAICLINIIPFKFRTGALTLRSDGAQILDQFRGGTLIPAPQIIQGMKVLRPHLEVVGDRLALRMNLLSAALSCQELGLTERAAATFAEAESVEVEDPPAMLMGFEAALRASAARLAGRYEEARVEGEAAEESFRQLGHEAGLLLTAMLRAESRAAAGDPSGALADVERISAHPRLASRADMRASSLATRLRLLASLDDDEATDRVRREYEEARRFAPSDSREAGVQLMLARWAARRGDDAKAAEAYEAMIKAIDPLTKMWQDPDDARSFLDAQASCLAEAEAGLARVGKALKDVMPEIMTDPSEAARILEEAHRGKDQRWLRAGSRLFGANVFISTIVLVLILADRTDFFEKPLIRPSIPLSAPHFAGLLLAAGVLVLTVFGGAAVLVVWLLGRVSPSLTRNYGRMVMLWASFPWMVALMMLLIFAARSLNR